MQIYTGVPLESKSDKHALASTRSFEDVDYDEEQLVTLLIPRLADEENETALASPYSSCATNWW
jgi:hypothetical protein